MSITLDLHDDIGLRLLEDPAKCEPDVRRELAIALYREGKLPPGRAAQVAGMDRWDFEELLVERKIPFPRSYESFMEEIKDALRSR
jgi:predicted HTH domain antitoxin